MAAPAANFAHNMVCGDDDSPADVILRIREKHMPSIINGDKNHKYREYRLDDEVARIWLYVNERKTIQYILTIGPSKIPGQVNMDGLGNRDFDLGLKESNFGYQILAVHKLPDALDRETLLHTYGVDMFLRGKQYNKRSLVDAFPLETIERVIPEGAV